ncbi:hypothetical protein HC891_09470 [Candidatus Gracilibacteria bacterium]|nr:hypothetical protein [Candidatus Gracilibacteria bacterium]
MRLFQSRRSLLIGVCCLMSLYTLLAISSAPTHSHVQVRPQAFVARIDLATRADVERLAGLGLDLLETQAGAARFALVTAAEYAELQRSGWNVSVDVRQSVLMRNAANATFAGYRNVEATEVFLRDIAARYPNLASIDDFGDSYDRITAGGPGGYDLLGLRLSNREIAGPKPVFVLMAALHAREWTTAEVATRFISYLVEGYGQDADVTWLLDEHTIVVVPLANPDGRKIAEQGLMQRKNRNPTYDSSCSTDRIGVDLNRNHSLRWGAVNAPDTPACSDVFPGAAQPRSRRHRRFRTILRVSSPIRCARSRASQRRLQQVACGSRYTPTPTLCSGHGVRHMTQHRTDQRWRAWAGAWQLLMATSPSKPSSSILPRAQPTNGLMAS